MVELSHAQFIVLQKMFVEYQNVELLIPIGEIAKAKKLYELFRAEDLIKRDVHAQSMSLADEFKDFLRDANRLNNQQSVEKYGISIDDLRTQVALFQEDLKTPNPARPVIPKPIK
jgi:hypothetical protein